jgi:trimeric autotransporter adhesin
MSKIPKENLMKNKIAHILVLAAFLCGLLTPASAAQAAVQMPPAKGVLAAPGGFLNPDGTLKLDGSFSGSLDLSSYNVSLDPARGPVFGPAAGGAASPAAAPATNHWGKMSSGGEVFNSTITAIAVSGTDVYVGGNFHNAAGIPEADGVAKWDGYSWSALGSNGNGGGAIWGSVSAIAVSGSNVYVGGSFTDINNGSTALNAGDYVAKWDGSNWSALGSNGAGNGALNGYVYALAADGATLYVGGYFTNVNNNGVVLNTADYIAKWDGANWSNLQSNGAGDGAINAVVFTLAVDASGNLYAGGLFKDVHDGIVALPSADYVAKWDGSLWAALGTGAAPDYGSLNGAVSALAVSGTNVYVGGSFSFVNNKGTILSPAAYIAKFDGSNWSALGNNGAGGPALNYSVSDIVVSGSTVYIAGGFTNVNSNGTVRTNADYVAKWNGTAWAGLGNNGAGNGSIASPSSAYGVALALSGSNVLLGGLFYDVNNGGTVLTQADNLAQWNGTAWSSVGSTVSGALTDVVYAVAISGTNVYVGGNFQNVENNGVNIPEADYIAKWDGTKWSALGSDGSGDGSLSNEVYAITVSGSNIYVGGNFSSVMNSNGNYVVGGDTIVRWDGTQWHGLGNDGSGNGPIGGRVFAIAVSGSNVYAGGIFGSVTNNGTVLNNADYIAKFNGTTWSALGDNGAGEGSLNNSVYAVAVIGANVYVGGSFDNVNNNGAVLPEADYIAKWNGSSWSALGNNGAGGGALNSSVYVLAASGANLYAGGSFYNVSNNGTEIPEADYIAKWDGSQWSALGSNGAGNGALQDSVYAIAVSGLDVYAGGYFTDTQNNNATINPADYIAKFDGTNWSALGNNGAGDGALNTGVLSIAVSGLNLYAGGWFTNVNDNGNVLQEADYMATFRLPNSKITYRSTGAQDGWILETGENTGLGGTLNAAATTMRLGDDAARKQYLSVLSFNTASLPDKAIITKVTLKVRQQGVVGGGNPVTAFQGFMAAIKIGFFGTTAGLVPGDFQAAATQTYGPFTPAAAGGWYSLNLTPGKASINKLASGGGLTQIRLRFSLDDNNNSAANYLSLYSGNAPLASRPQLLIEYYLP